MKNSKQLIRILNTDIQADKNTYHGLQKIKGVSYSFSNALCHNLQIDKNKKISELSKEEIAKIENYIKKPKVKSWILNHRRDYETGNDIHISTTDLRFRIDNIKKRLMKIKSYRGLRLSVGLPVRGQRTKGHFRKGKSVVTGKKPKGRK
jgi:small subunit ribosomal protein S13